jgi:16S rRNA processing protein RimM
VAADDIIIVGKITGTYGVKGWVKLFSWTEPREAIGEYRPWLLRQGNRDGGGEGWREVKLESARAHAKTVIAKIEQVDDRDAAQLLSGSEIGIYKSQLETLQDNEFYWRDLIGLRVLGKQGELLGEVQNLMETGANDVLVVRGEKEYLVPWVMGKSVIKVDLDRGEILVDWDAGWTAGD